MARPRRRIPKDREQARRGDAPLPTLADLDELDRRIIDHLQTDGRRSNTAIARALGVAEATVRHRIERLIAGKFIRITAVIDPRMTAYRVDAIIWFRVQRSMAHEVTRQLASFPNVVYVAHVTGRYDLVVEALFESDEDLFDFLVNRLSGQSGLLHTETCHVLRTVKINYDWKLPLGHRSKTGPGRRQG